MFVVDAYSPPAPAFLDQIGAAGATVYISQVFGKNAQPWVVDWYFNRASPKLLVLNHEQNADDMTGGASAGRDHATYSVQRAGILGAWNAPRAPAIYYSADQDYQPWQVQEQVIPYLAACRDVHRATRCGLRVGGYGSADTGAACLAAGVVDLWWQTTAWSDGRRLADAVLYQDQYLGAYDVDEVTGSDIGAWIPPTLLPATKPVPKPRPRPAPAPIPEDDPMYLIQPDPAAYKAGDPWPGLFLLCSDGSLRHVTPSVTEPTKISNEQAFLNLGIKGPQTVTRAQFETLRAGLQ